MIWNYVYGFCATVGWALLLGYPFAAWLGFGRGLRALGYASGCGVSLLLIACRGAQMLAPIGSARWTLLAGFGAAAVVAWSRRSVRSAAVELLSEHGRDVAGLLCVMGVIGTLLGGPILFGGAIQFDGSRNGDSFTFTSSARYMLAHVFYGAPDFTPEHPVFAISRGYFGAGAMQPRPAAEGLLAWLSALRGVDPMYVYNSVQAAGAMLAGLAALSFLPAAWRVRNLRDGVLLAIYALACPSLLHVATNSNFANAFNLPAAACYGGTALSPRTRGSFIMGVLFIGCLLSGYPELLVFAGATRGMMVLCGSVASRMAGGMAREAAWMATELTAAAVLLPWAALGTIAVFHTTLTMSQAGAVQLGGNMYAGVPMFVAAALALGAAWRSLALSAEQKCRACLFGILLAFAQAQLLMLARGFGYGGFKLSEYFVVPLAGLILRSLICAPAGARLGRTAIGYAAVLAALLTIKSADVLRRAWAWSQVRRVTPDMVRAADTLSELADGRPVAMGASPDPFYYGMWIPYVTGVAIAYDLRGGSNAAGYLSPYLRSTERSKELYDEAKLQVDIDEAEDFAIPSGIAQFGRVTIRSKQVLGER